MRIKKSIIPFCLLLVLTDQITKYIIRTNFRLYQTKQLLPFLAITYTTNTGIVFGWFQGANLVFIVVVSIILTIFFLSYKNIVTEFGVVGKIVSCLILSGGVSNLIDRIFFGKVTDFIDLQWNYRNVWPIFNLADSYIFIGICLLTVKYISNLLKKENIKLKG